MKKLLVMLAMLSLVSMAQANVWNFKWAIGGAYSPDDSSTPVLDDYSVTWAFFYESEGGDVEIASMYAPAQSDEISITDPYNNEVLCYNNKLKPDDSTTYYGITNESGTKSVYQYIFLDNGTDQYEWKSSSVDIELKSSTSDPPVSINSDVLLGKTTAWTKVGGVPEPTTMSLLGLGALAMVLRRKLSK